LLRLYNKYKSILLNIYLLNILQQIRFAKTNIIFSNNIRISVQQKSIAKTEYKIIKTYLEVAK